MDLATDLIGLWTARRTRLLNNEKVYAGEGEYRRAIECKAEAHALLMAMEDFQRLYVASEAMRLSRLASEKPGTPPETKGFDCYPLARK